MPAQMEQTFRNPDRCLKAVGATWADVVNINTFVAEVPEVRRYPHALSRGRDPRLAQTVGPTRLAGPDFMIEIEAVAVVRSGSGPSPARRPGKPDPSTGQTGSVAAPIEDVLPKGDWLLAAVRLSRPQQELRR
jgi:hypothetical protein